MSSQESHKDEHTPLPWELFRWEQIYSSTGDAEKELLEYSIVGTGKYEEDIIAQCLTREDAELVLRAVHGYDALAKKVEEWARLLGEPSEEVQRTKYYYQYDGMMAEAGQLVLAEMRKEMQVLKK